MTGHPSNGLGAEVAAVLRVRPPDGTMRWLLDVLEAVEVVAVEPLRGGTTSALHRVTVRSSNGTPVTVVMRRYVRAGVVEETPDIAHREMTALRLVAGSSIPAPALLAADPDATVTAAPTIVMSALEGRVVWEPRRRREWLAEIAAAIVDVHTIAVPSEVAVHPIARYDQRNYQPPDWAERPDVWETAIEIFRGPIPGGDNCFVHRDFHPGNLLWRRGRISGVVDWQAACIGPASIDPAHCRMNLLYFDQDLADEFREVWEQRSGLRFHPWADVMSIIGILDNLRQRPPSPRARRAMETALAHAIAALAR